MGLRSKSSTSGIARLGVGLAGFGGAVLVCFGGGSALGLGADLVGRGTVDLTFLGGEGGLGGAIVTSPSSSSRLRLRGMSSTNSSKSASLSSRRLSLAGLGFAAGRDEEAWG